MRPPRLFHRNIIADTLRIGVLTTLVKAIGAVKTVITARYFGRSDQLDAYLMAFLIPAFVGDVLAGAITQAFLPVLVEVRESRTGEEAERLYGRVFWGSLVFLSGVGVAVALFTGVLLHWIASGFTAAKIELTRDMLFVMLPIVPLSACNVTWRTLLNAEERFTIAALAPVLTPVTTIVFVMLLGQQWGIYSMAAGTMAGATLEIVLLAAAIRAAGNAVFPRWSPADSASRRVFLQYVPVASSNVIMGGSSVVDQMMAATLGSGSVSALNYGTRLVGVILAVGPAALGTAILPRLSRLTANENWTGFRRMVRTYSILSIAATLPATAALVYFSGPLVRLFFERGAFTSVDTKVVTLVQAFSLLQIPFSVLLALLVRVVSSLKKNWLLLNVALVSLAANIVFDLLLMRSYGVAGIALSTTAVHAIAVAYVAVLIFRSAPNQPGRAEP